MSISFSPTPNALRVEIRSSNHVFAVLSVVALIATAAIFHAQLSWPLRFSFIGLIGAYTGYCWRVQKRQRGMLQWHSGWSWIDDKNVKRTLQLRHATVWPGLIALRFYDAGRKRHIAFTLLPDSFVSTDDARRLRVHLRHFPVFDSSPKKITG